VNKRKKKGKGEAADMTTNFFGAEKKKKVEPPKVIPMDYQTGPAAKSSTEMTKDEKTAFKAKEERETTVNRHVAQIHRMKQKLGMLIVDNTIQVET